MTSQKRPRYKGMIVDFLPVSRPWGNQLAAGRSGLAPIINSFIERLVDRTWSNRLSTTLIKNFLQRSSLKYRANKVFLLIMFIRLNAAAFIKIFVIQVRCLFEGGVYLKFNLLFANNIMVTDHFNCKKQKRVLVLVLNFTICVLILLQYLM